MSGAIAMGSSKITGLANGTASGDAVHQGQIASLQRVVSVKVDIESNTTDDEVPLAVMPACTVVEAYIASDTATSGSGATQRYGFNIKNRDVDGTGTNELAAADLKTDATELAAFDTAPIGLDQNLTVTAGQLLTLLIDVDNGGGNPTDLSSAEIVVTIVYTLTVT